MLYLLIAVVAFSCGFLAAGLMAAGRRWDDRRAREQLAEAVGEFTIEHDDRRFDVGDRVAVARNQLDRLERALEIHDALRAS